MTLTMGTIDTIRALQKQIGAANAEKGFHQDGFDIRSLPAFISGVHDEPRTFLRRLVDRIARMIPALERHYWMARASLITTEVAELLEELRKGRGVAETYYPSWQDEVDASGQPWNQTPFERGKYKPEGVPSELADVVIRALDYAEEANIDLADIIDEKLSYNATRARLHGKKL